MGGGLTSQGVRELYQFKCDVAEIHDEYHVHAMLLWEAPNDEEYVAGDSFRIRADAVEASGEHEAIMMLIRTACTRMAQKLDRTLF